MRQRHFAGEKLFVDYAGRTVPIYGATCEEAFRASIFVGALGASGYAYAEATRTATLAGLARQSCADAEFYGHAAPRSWCPTIRASASPKRIAMSRSCSARTRRWPRILGSR
jgi:transposase